MELLCPQAGAGGRPRGRLRAAWADWSWQGPVTACPPLRRRPLRGLAPALPWGGRFFSGRAGSALPGPQLARRGCAQAPGWLLGWYEPQGAVPRRDVGGFQKVRGWKAPRSEAALRDGDAKVQSALVPGRWGLGHGKGHRTRGEGRFWWRGLLVCCTPKLGVRGLGRLLGRKAQPFPSTIEVFLSVSYYSLGTSSGLSAIRGTKKRQDWCQIAYCLKCRFVFFPQSESTQRKPEEKK